MPPALLAAITVASSVGEMVNQNVQQKATVKDAQNAEASAQANVTKAQGTATGSLNDYLKANPGPAQAGNAPSAAPAYSGASIPIAGAPRPAAPGTPGPGMMSAPGSGAPSAGTQLPPQVLAMLKQAMSGSA